MAKTESGEYYYDAGTVNEQLDDYDVYQEDGQLYLNKGPDGDYVKMDGVAQILGGARDTELGEDELEMHEGGLYIFENGGGGYELHLAFNTGSGVVVNVLDGDLTAA